MSSNYTTTRLGAEILWILPNEILLDIMERLEWWDYVSLGFAYYLEFSRRIPGYFPTPSWHLITEIMASTPAASDPFHGAPNEVILDILTDVPRESWMGMALGLYRTLAFRQPRLIPTLDDIGIRALWQLRLDEDFQNMGLNAADFLHRAA
ncbi:hypothetical protein EJ06DRAFT_167678 [Trichodelitschia bisporula]|uniref:Uncharacterized protein n=1 Tax=Trichodelitschia bisporula TaxID=703511 RepID=A0A6G1HML3_9PEZI|nr:hypothetical protein EJ06DRAFT_167678 [Trichodelitschia bisporula]